MYKLSKKAIKAINTPEGRRHLCSVLNCVERTIIRYITDNESNNELTKWAAMEVIRKHTGMKDTEILVRLKLAA